eukprot:evm.model.scf_1229.5 EVM.evm.TU.scf_1229.5   scf_1229:30866-32968(+)
MNSALCSCFAFLRSRLLVPPFLALLVRTWIAWKWLTSLCLHPVQVNTAASSDVPSTQFQFDFEFEKKLLARHGAAGDSSMHVSDDGQGQSCGQDKAGVLFDPWEESINQYGHMGYSKEEVCMALCACGGNQEQIATFCQNYRKLKELGYAPAIITGALIIHRGNFDAALHMCLDIS